MLTETEAFCYNDVTRHHYRFQYIIIVFNMPFLYTSFASHQAKVIILIASILVSGVIFSRADVLLESPALSPVRRFFTVGDSGTLRQEADGWILFTPPSSPRETATIRLDLSEVRFRSFNRLVIEFDNRNDGTAVDWRLDTELPKHGDIKGKHFAKKGVSESVAKLPGLGAPACLRELRLSLRHGIGESRDARPSTASQPLRFRMRLQLSGDGLDKTLDAGLATALDHKLPEGFLPEERKAAESVRNRLKGKAEVLR